MNPVVSASHGSPDHNAYPNALIQTSGFTAQLAANPSYQHVDALAVLGKQQHYRRGELLIREGEVVDALYIVLQGRLRAFLADDAGKELTLGVYGPREHMGEMSLDGKPHSSHVEALEVTTCSVVPHDALLAFIGARPEFALELVGRLIRRARLATEIARSVALTDVYGRLVRLLRQLATAPGPQGERRLSERMTHQAIARQLACSREMVSRLLRDLERGGYIAVKDRWITLLKPLPARW
ncbi:MAG: Crp/Fnr family transcriptional regulator [Hydrogenophaga sp.]|jgi:CRP/FNR family cyclic AMP-dependent transcriptional regulator|nr:Crp/Fnr family transcriptional regulator [Hydrogenophaga sp.]